MATPDFIRQNKRRYNYGRGVSSIHFICLIGGFQAGKSVFINEFRLKKFGQNPEAGKFVEAAGRTTVVEASESVDFKDINNRYRFVEIPGFQNQPPHDGDGAIIREIARFLVEEYENHGFAGLVYLHDFSQSTAGTVIQRDIALFRAMIGKELYDHTALVLNKYGDELRTQFPARRPEIQEHWRELTAHRAVIRENKPPRGDPRPIVELIWEKPPDAFALAKELKEGTRLCDTSVGKVYRDLLKKEIKEAKRSKVGIINTRREELEKELSRWNKCKDTYSTLSGQKSGTFLARLFLRS